MFRKHPVIKFSATGPIDKEKTPYKWWCRVCKIELSLMSRGPLELISHYKTDSHLVKEHRIRMETPGLVLYDREEVELQGIALQEAKRTAKDTYPIPPQLGPRRLPVVQDSLPDIKSDSSPIEVVLAQLRILEFGLKYGGSLASLVGVHDEILQHTTTTNDFQPFNWENSRIFVSNHLLCFSHTASKSHHCQNVSFLYILRFSILCFRECWFICSVSSSVIVSPTLHHLAVIL